MDINNKIKEQRTVQAINKDLMGSQGKIALTCQAFGEPIIYDNEISDSDNYLNINDGFYDFDENEIKTFSENHSSYQIGFWYDGINLGNGIEIKFLIHENEIKLYHRGSLKYHEESNNLIVYNPNGDWEKTLESLYFVAKKRIIEKNKKILEENQVAKEKEKKNLIDDIRKNWGDDFF